MNIKKSISLQNITLDTNLLSSEDGINLSTKEQEITNLLVSGQSMLVTGAEISALTFFEQASNLDEKCTEAQIACGEIYVSLRRYQEAVNFFKKALFNEPENRIIWKKLSNALFLARENDDAITLCKTMLNKWSECGEAHLLLARLYSRIDKHEEAIFHYNEAIYLGLKIDTSSFELGLLLLKTNNPKEAIVSLQRSLREAPNNPITRFHLGQAWLELADFKTAKSYFEKYLESCPEDYLGASKIIDEISQKTTSLPTTYIRELFNQYADSFDKNLTQTLQYKVPKLIAKEVFSLSENNFKNVVDLGCGTGLAGEEIKNLNLNLFGIDLSPTMIKKALNKNVYSKLVVGDVLQADSIFTQKFDLAIAADVLVYFGDLKPFFATLNNLLEDDGIFIASTENCDNSSSFEFKESRRFGHSIDYLLSIASIFNFQKIKTKNIVPRLEKGNPISGNLIVLKKLKCAIIE